MGDNDRIMYEQNDFQSERNRIANRKRFERNKKLRNRARNQVARISRRRNRQ